MAKAKKKDITDLLEADDLNEDDIVVQVKAIPVDDNAAKENYQDLPESMPLMPLRDIVVFPDMILPLFVGRDKSVRAIEEAVADNGMVFLTVQSNSDEEIPAPQNIHEFGTVCRILRMLKLPDGRLKILVQGLRKAVIQRYIRKRGFYKVKVEYKDEERIDADLIEIKALMRNVVQSAEKIMSFRGEFTPEAISILHGIEYPGKLTDLIASNMHFKIDEVQHMLETLNVLERLHYVNELLSKELELTEMQAKIQSDVKHEISKNQKDYFLREQVRAIYRELGEQDEKTAEFNEYEKKIKQAKMPKKAEEEAWKQLRRLEQMHADSAEASIVRTYLDWLTELPWSKASKSVIDIKATKKILDADHAGLDKVKARILEYLAVRKLNPNMKSPILCLVGPPGVGKTSLGQSIARAMGRKFVRISLGGMHDEAEIRGHRRTYVGSMPGRILQGLKNAGTNNPVFMMDEIDKMGSDFRGDPASALLEALDPAQNSEFTDNFINLPFDLSKVVFILTANYTDTIPHALFDRMEVIDIAGYTTEEKLEITQNYIIPRQLAENGLKPKNVHLSKSVLAKIIVEYTMEAGLRNLEREIGTLFRKIAREIVEGAKGPFHITVQNIHKYLGVPHFYPEMDKEESQVGLVTGLAWTPVGGETLYIEATKLKGKGEMLVTGQIGEVMLESSRAALTFVRRVAREYGIKKAAFENFDLHVHVPAGAIPKDGPSAGIAMATAITSVLANRKARSNVAMTGEVTLRGRVLPIGGLKEKALGALQAGIDTIIIPQKNCKDLVEMPLSVKRKIKFIAVSNMEEVLELALLPPEEAAAKTGKPQKAKKAKKSAKKKKASQNDGGAAAVGDAIVCDMD